MSIADRCALCLVEGLGALIRCPSDGRLPLVRRGRMIIALGVFILLGCRLRIISRVILRGFRISLLLRVLVILMLWLRILSVSVLVLISGVVLCAMVGAIINKSS